MNKKNKNQVSSIGIDNYIESNGFALGQKIIVNNKLTIAINQKENRFAIIKNYDAKDLSETEFIDFPVYNIMKMQPLKSYVELSFVADLQEQVLKIPSKNKEVKKFLYEIFKKVKLAAIQKKYPEIKFDIVSASDWQSTYIWAFSSKNAFFVYYDTENQFVSHLISLLRTNLILDIKYSYFEMSIYGIKQQLIAYENDFYDNMFNVLIKKIDEKYACVLKNALYYDNNNNVVFLTNGINSIQVLNLETVKEVYYSANKLSFKMIQSDKMINYNASKELVQNFEDFVINLNLKQITQNYNYTSDITINTYDYTKVIIDNTRSRVVYCANLNSLENFSYCVMAFDTIKDVEYFKNGQNIFVRVYLNKRDIIDISCKKAEVAHYILAQIKIIINEHGEKI